MLAIDELHRAVQTTLATKRLGTPVFVRYQIYSRDRAATIIGRLARIAGVVQSWLDQQPERLYALGSAKAGQITLTLEFQGGATSLVSWARSQARGDGVDLMLIGNHGALYHDGGTSVLWDDPAEPSAAAPNKNVITAIERALRSGAPEAVKTK